ncbi:hypothetical protein ACW9HQ_24830 [Nocardia gipuzkoensis]
MPLGLPSAWDIVIPTDDDSITRRRRALAPIQVLIDLERTKSSLAGDFWGDYDLFTVALAVIDQVALAMGISAGKTWDDALRYAADQAARQTPGRSPGEWETVAERVLVSLVTTEVEVVKHLVHTPDGPAWRNQRFRLLYLHPSGGDGIEHLRASEQAINIFVEALDLDIEAAQIANEAQLTALIARGAVASAVEIARHARYRSIQYQERVRRIVADTVIDPDLHDWVGEVPALLDGALAHVSERLQAEAALLDAVADRRTEVTDRTQLEIANQLIEILRECRGRHHDLHRHLMGARSRLREALDDRFARPPRAIRRVDIGNELLSPLLARTTGDGAECAERLVAIMGGLPVRWWPSLTRLTDELCAPPRPPDLGDEFAPPEIDDSDELEWWEPYEETIDALIGGINEPIRLSQLLARAADIAERADEYEGLDPGTLSAVLVHAAHRAWSAQLAGRAAGDRVVVAVSTGACIDTADIRADDLLLVPGEVTADIDAPAVRPPHQRFEDDEEPAE